MTLEKRGMMMRSTRLLI